MIDRQPKGTPVGGQFADGRKPEGADLSVVGDIPTGIYFEAEQMTVRDGDVKVVGIARDLGFGLTGSSDSALGTYNDETVSEIGERAVAWLNESRRPDGFYWAFEEGSFGLWADDPASDVDSLCSECGQTMTFDDNGVSHHVDNDGEIDYDSDADHVAFAEDDSAVERTALLSESDQEQPRDDDYCDYCETEGHTFRTCPRRDDSPDHDMSDDFPMSVEYDTSYEDGDQ